jgi:hypothetical protein
VGWAILIKDFLQISPNEILNILQSCRPAGERQQISWKNAIVFLQTAFQNIISLKSISPYQKASFQSWGIIFEYDLPLEGTRPDIIILTPENVFVIEVKDTLTIRKADIDQTRGYVRDIENYHGQSRELVVKGILWVLQSNEKPRKIHNTWIITKNYIESAFGTLLKSIPDDKSEPVSTDFDKKSQEMREFMKKWIDSPYEPLPKLIQAAKWIFQFHPLPQIKRAQSAGIPELIAYLHQLVETAKEKHEHHLILIGGVPGSGKTLVGLQFAHEFSSQNDFALYLSGNMPLVKVLQDYLGGTGKTFVRDVVRFIEDYWVKKIPMTKQRVIIFDEAQRAWDADRVQRQYNKKKYNHASVHLSEPEIFARLVGQIDDWGILIGLIGDGQEIHIGEEKGLAEWSKAVLTTNIPWKIHLPSRFAPFFINSTADPRIEIKENAILDLTTTLRTHAAENLHHFIAKLLENELDQAAQIAKELKQNHYMLYITGDLAKAKEFLHLRYEGDTEKTYGILASSIAKNLPKYGLNAQKHTDPTCETTRFFGANDVPRWYNWKDNSQRKDLYCTRMKKLVTEFDCQGLEVDSALVAWGSDLIWSNHRWRPKVTRSRVQNPSLIRLNAYRVLLTRGRDGIIIFCPDGPEMGDTHLALLQAGFEELENNDLQHWQDEAAKNEIYIDFLEEESLLFDDRDLTKN